jgi:predicted RecA/RadA family phage recombinase
MVIECLGPYKCIEFTAAADHDAGDVVVNEDLLTFTLIDILTDAKGSGFYEAEQCKATKPTDETWTPGELLYYDSALENFTTTSTGNTVAGYVREAAALTDTYGIMDFDGKLAAVWAAIAAT